MVVLCGAVADVRAEEPKKSTFPFLSSFSNLMFGHFHFHRNFYLKFIIWLVDGGVMRSGGRSKSRRTDKIYSRRRPPAITMLQLTFFSLFCIIFLSQI